MISQDSLVRTGLEVYKTEDTNKEESKQDTTVETSSENTEDSTTTSSNSNSTVSNTDKEGFVLHNGPIKEIYYTANITDTSFEYDYEDISSNGNISLPEVDNTRFYKGIRVLLKKEWEEPGKNLKWDDLKNVLLGFITEQSYSEDGVELKISGMTKLLDQEKQFSFTQTKRSEILKQMIESAGLKAKIDVTGLKDDVIDYTNVSSSSSSEATGIGNVEIDELVKEIIGNETDDLAKAKKIHQWLMENVIYASYECSKYHTPEECLKNKSHLNCADTARLTCAMMKSAGLTAYVVHGPYHFWTMIEIGGKKYASDQTGRESAGMSGSAFNTVWWQGRGRSSAIPPYSKNGDNPSC